MNANNTGTRARYGSIVTTGGGNNVSGGGIDAEQVVAERVIRRRTLTGDQSFINGLHNSQRQTLLDEVRAYYSSGDAPVNMSAEDLEDFQEFYSDLAMLKRDAIRFDRQIMDVLNWIWTVSDDDGSGGVDYEEYITMYSKLYRYDLLTSREAAHRVRVHAHTKTNQSRYTTGYTKQVQSVTPLNLIFAHSTS